MESDLGGWLLLAAVSLDLELLGEATWEELRSWFEGLTVGSWSLEPLPKTLTNAKQKR